MHFVSRVDGLDHVVVLDGLALSSWCLPDEVVSNTDIHASSRGVLSTDGKGTLLLAWDDGYDMSHLYTVGGLERTRRYPRFKLKPSFLDASGKALLRLTDFRSPTELERCNLKGESKARQALPFPESIRTTLEATPGAPLWSRSRCVSRGGLVGLVDKEGATLLVDFRKFDTPQVLASALLWAPPSWDVELTCLDTSLGVIAHDVAGGQAVAWVLSGEEVLEKRGLTALTMPCFAGKDSLLSQVSEGELALVPLRDGPARTFRLPELGRETRLDPRGPGTPIAGPGVVAFLPWHRESLITFDAETGEPSEVSRLLPEDSRELRQFILQKLRMANEAARPTGTRFELQGLECVEKWGRCNVSFSTHGGDGSLWARVVQGAVNGLHADMQGRGFGPWQVGSLSHAIMQDATCPLTDVDGMASILERVDRYGLRLSSLVPVLEQLYERATTARWGSSPHGAPLTDEAAGLLLQALFTVLGEEAPVALAPKVAQWRKAPASLQELVARVPHLHPSHAGTEPRLLTPLARMAAVHFGPKAGPLLLALTLEAHPHHLNNAKHELLDVLRWWTRKHPDAAKSLAPTVGDDTVRAALAMRLQ